jgi:acyl-CoA dehydrogenase family protein 9
MLSSTLRPLSRLALHRAAVFTHRPVLAPRPEKRTSISCARLLSQKPDSQSQQLQEQEELGQERNGGPDGGGGDGLGAEALETFARQNAGLSSIDDAREAMPPFAKGMLEGKVNIRVLSYPDVLENDRYYALQDRCDRIKKHLHSKKDLVNQIDADQKISKDVLLPLRGLDAFGLQCGKPNGGQGLGMMETMKVLEEFSVNMSLSEALSVSNTVGIMPIAKFASERAKAKYLNKLASGEWTGAYCISDDFAGVDPSQTNCRVFYDRADDVYVLNGKKTWVSNASSSDVFTVFAISGVPGVQSYVEEKISAMIVPRDSPGVTVIPSNVEKVGLKGLETATVQFTQVRVPAEDILLEAGKGDEVFAKTVLRDRALVGARVSAALRNLLDDTIDHVMRRRSFGRTLSQFELVRDRVSRMSAMIYALESMTYLTAGLADVQLDPDIELEACMTKWYAAKTAKYVVHGCASLFGGRAYLKDHPAARLKRDMEALELWEGTTDMVHVAMSQIACHHVIKKKIEHDKSFRNPLTIPSRLIRRAVWELRHKYQDIPMTMNIAGNVHPTLKVPSEVLEYCVLRLEYAIDCTFDEMNHGHEEHMKEVDLLRIAEAATECYSIAAVLARANKSYCHGHRHTDIEREVCMLSSIESLRSVQRLVKELAEGYEANNDDMADAIAHDLVSAGKYLAEHPVSGKY